LRLVAFWEGLGVGCLLGGARGVEVRIHPHTMGAARGVTPCPLGPLGFDFAQHRQTLRPSVL
jgi:hypothetical protein